MLKKTVLISTILVACAGAQAQTSASFSVAGTVNPPSCVLTLNGGSANIDYGTMAAPAVRSLPTSGVTAAHYQMPTKTVPWSVACTAPMPFELVIEDGKAGKVTPFDPAIDSYRFGLVDGSSASVGSMAWSLSAGTSVTADGSSVYGYFNVPKGTTAWGSPQSTGPTMTPGKAYALAKLSTSTAPLWVTTANGTFTSVVFVKKQTVDTAVSSITFSGSTTFTLQYL